MSCDLTIIILTYNSSHIISNCLNNINFDKYKIIVIDNASKDQTAQIVQKNYPHAELIKVEKNLGYGNGNNIGLEKVKTDFALILNPDAIISENDIEKVLNEMKQSPNAALAGPLILEKIDQLEIEEKLSQINNDLNGPQKNHYKKIGNQIQSGFVSGAALFMNMKIMRKIGFFDKNIFLYYEDEELCQRSIRNRYKNLVICNSYASHIGQASSKSSLRGIFRRNWHFNGWSKLYLRQINKGKFKAKRLAVKLTIFNFIKALMNLLEFKLEKSAAYFGASCGSFGFLIGLKAFKNDGTPRG